MSCDYSCPPSKRGAYFFASVGRSVGRSVSLSVGRPEDAAQYLKNLSLDCYDIS
jgi:hypothetical protein